MSENIGSILRRPARLFPDRIAVIEGDEQWTYAEFERRVGAFDAALDGFGLDVGDVVGIVSLNSTAHLTCWFGIPRSGRVMNTINTRLAFSEMRFICEDAGVKVLIVDDQFADTGARLRDECESIQTLVFTGSGDAPEDSIPFAQLLEGEPREPRPLDPDTLAGIFYTGGTTGLPKGVMLSHRNLVSNAKHMLIGSPFTRDDIYLHAAPMFHLADGLNTFALAWVGGGHAIIPQFETKAWMECVQTVGVTREMLVPTMINMIVNHPDVSQYDLSTLKIMMYGGSPMPTEVQKRAMEVIGCDFQQVYGLTETAPIVTFLHPEDHRRGVAGEEPYASRLRSAGAPVVGVESGVFLPDGTRAEVGDEGEVWVRGPNIMQGYWNRPEETAAALDDNGWFHTGDAAREDEDGYIYIVDRVKDMIVSGGENVYSVEVENAIYQHQGVLEAAVFGVPDEKWGERVHAVIVPKPDADLDEEQVVKHCRELIAGYKLPRSVEFRDEALPKSGAGKMLKRDLRAPYWEGQERQVS